MSNTWPMWDTEFVSFPSWFWLSRNLPKVYNEEIMGMLRKYVTGLNFEW